MLEVAIIPAAAAAAAVAIGVALFVTSNDELSMALVGALTWAVLLLAFGSLALVLSFFVRVELPVAVVGVVTGVWLWTAGGRGSIVSAGSMVAVFVAGQAVGFGPLVTGVVAAALLLDRLLAARAAGNKRNERAAAERLREAQLREILSKWAAQRHDDPELDERLQAADWRPDAPLEESRATYLAVWEALKAERRARGERIWRPHR